MNDFATIADFRSALADALQGLGQLQADAGQTQQAEATLRRALALREKLAADFATLPDQRWALARDLQRLAASLGNTGRQEQSSQMSSRASALRKQLASAFPEVDNYFEETVSLNIGR